MGRRQRRHSPVHGAATSALTTTPPWTASRTASTSTTAPEGTALALTARSGRGPLRCSSRRVPEWRRSVVTLTAKGLGADIAASRVRPWWLLAVLVEEPSFIAAVAFAQGAAVGGHGCGPQLLATGQHRLHGSVEDDLEGGQLLVAVVLGLETQAPRLLAGGVDGALGGVLGFADDLGALHHA